MSELYECPYCHPKEQVKAKSEQGFKRHMQSAHPNEEYFICPSCTTVAKSEQGLKKHRASKKH